MSPLKFYLCRSDKQTKTRHIEKVHAITDAQNSHIQFVDINDLEAKEALNCYRKAINMTTVEKGNKYSQETTATGQSAGASILSPLQVEDEIPAENLLPSADEHQTTGTSQISYDNALESKLNTVIDMLKNLSTKIEKPSPSYPAISTIVKELSTNENSQLDWRTIENVMELTEKVSSIRFFAGQNGQNGCVRCQTCFDYVFAREGVLAKRDPMLIDNDDGQAIANHIKKYDLVFKNRFSTFHLFNVGYWYLCL